jgi:hypothetical protein
MSRVECQTLDDRNRGDVISADSELRTLWAEGLIPDDAVRAPSARQVRARGGKVGPKSTQG